MGKVTILPDTLCNQIAAGEVVERPAAVVKELMENSIDASSRRITVKLLQGGRKEVCVVDNGRGMSSEDALLALERHATSKIKSMEDLEAILSLGFRGEAIPSIAAVSRFELVTREPEAIAGTLIRIEGGVLRDVREAGCPPGTMVTVRDLFHNIPARRKFLRSVETEMSHIGDQFIRLALAHPEIHFQLFHEARQQYDFPRARSASERAGQVLGTELASKLRPILLERSSMTVRGLAGGPDLQRANGQSMFVCVNGRPIRDRTLNHAVLSGYDTLIPRGKYPVVVLFLDLPPALVDVNVHPTKREVRFRSPGDVIEAVRFAVRTAIEDSQARSRAGGTAGGSVGGSAWAAASGSGSLMPRTQFSRETQISMKDVYERSPLGAPASPTAPISPGGPGVPGAVDAPGVPAGATDFDGGFLHEAAGGAPVEGEGRAGEDSASAGSISGDAPRFSRLLVIGQLANSYILLESEDGLIIIDQHAAHERVVYDELSSQPSGTAGQRLARSVVLDLLPREAQVLRRWIDQLSRTGFEIEPFGGDSFVIHAVPAVLSGYSPEELIRGLFEAAREEENDPRLDLLAGLSKTVACHKAIRAGQKLHPEEIKHLLRSLDRLAIPATCPHGRPLWHRITHGQIARLFHRT